MAKHFQIPAVLLIGVLLSHGSEANELFFRYKDANGNTVLNDQLPPSAVNGGYEVIRLDGTVVKRVEGLTDAEKASLGSVRESQRRHQQEQERLQKWDETLLLRYSEVADIEAAKKRATGEIQIRISILKGNLGFLKTQIEQAEARAAGIERSGQEVPKQEKETITILKNQISDVESLIVVRQNELIETTQKYDQDLQRFKILQERIGTRH